MHREHKDFGFRNCISHLTHCLDSIQFGHPDINDCNVRFQFYSFLYCLTAIRCLANYFPAGL
jgi:hypothetical protein